MPDQDVDQDTTPAPIVAPRTLPRTDQAPALRLAQAIEGAAIEDAAAVYQAFAKVAKGGASWRASDAFLERFLAPILDAERTSQAGADLPQAIEDGSLAAMLTDLAERIAIRSGLDLTTGAQAGADRGAQVSGSARSLADQDDAGTFETRLDSLRIAVIRERVTGRDPGPRKDDPRRDATTPPHLAKPDARGEGDEEAMEPPHGQNLSDIGGSEIVDVEFREESGFSGARESMYRDRGDNGEVR